jgi:hypothetical protein
VFYISSLSLIVHFVPLHSRFPLTFLSGSRPQGTRLWVLVACMQCFVIMLIAPLALFQCRAEVPSSAALRLVSVFLPFVFFLTKTTIKNRKSTLHFKCYCKHRQGCTTGCFKSLFLFDFPEQLLSAGT